MQFMFLFLLTVGTVGMITAGVAILPAVLKRLFEGNAANSEDLERLQSQVNELRDELRDMRELLADLTPAQGESERKSLSRDES